LPSTLLLLDDILKETPRTHRDHDLLVRAIASLKEVMTHINEDKRKVENHLNMFVLMHDIENCPATLLSSHRNFLKKMDVVEISNELVKKGVQLTLFLFSDCLEVIELIFFLNSNSIKKLYGNNNFLNLRFANLVSNCSTQTTTRVRARAPGRARLANATNTLLSSLSTTSPKYATS
jgi:hypothetical protein